MAKNSVFDWDATAANNTDVGGVGITGSSLPSNLDDAMRTLMAQVKAFQTYLGITSSSNIWDKSQIWAGADADGETIVEFRTDRPWFWRQRGDDVGASLSLENITQKLFGMSNDATWAQHNIIFDPRSSGASITINGYTTYHRGNILGTASETGGVPTGAVVERGSNANGNYTRYADGTQICWRSTIYEASLAAGTGVDGTWTLPASFVNSSWIPVVAPRGIGTGSGTQDIARYVGAAMTQNASVSSGIWAAFNRHSSAITVRLDLLAIGRWY